MQRIICLLFTGLLAANVCLAQFSATGGVNGAPFVYKPNPDTGLDDIFVFDGPDNARLIYTTDNAEGYKWYRFVQNPSNAVPVLSSDVQASSGVTELTNVQAGYGYFVEYNNVRRYVYVVEYNAVDYGDINPCIICDVCNTLAISTSRHSAERLIYYSTAGSAKELTRTYTLFWNTLEWNLEDKKYVTKLRSSISQSSPSWSIDAPLTDTYFKVGDQLALFFGDTVRSQNKYQAVAVQTNADWVIQERSAENEFDKVSTTGELSGSAPLNVQFRSHSSAAAESLVCIWEVYGSADSSANVIRHIANEDLFHTFEQTGTFLVKVTVSRPNGQCSASKTFTAKVSESYIECPNFFTPRSTPGENDEFRVAYKSIISFKGVIINRWGNVLFEWSNPAIGWNGTYKGKAVSPGVYFYLIEAEGSDGIKYKKKGDINLLE